MNKEIQLVLDAIAGRRANSKGIVRANCPFCDVRVHKVDKKGCLSVSLGTGFWRCYRCGADGRLGSDDLPADTRSLIASRAAQQEPTAPVNLPEGFIPLWTAEARAEVCQAALAYLAKDRIGVTPRILELAGIGTCVRGKFVGRVVVPIYKAGKLAGYVGRVWKKRPPSGTLVYRYSEGFSRGDTLYNEEALYVTTDAPAIIVEGVFDTFPFWRPSERLSDGVAVLGKPSPPQIEMLREANRPLLIVFDGDAHREATALAMSLRLSGKRAAALRLPPGVDPDEAHEHVKQRALSALAEVEKAS